MRHLDAVSITLAALLVTASCRTSRSAMAEVPDDTVPIKVTNTIGHGTATIFILPEFGIERLVGSVGDGETATLTFTGLPGTARIQLRAVHTGSRQTISESFVLPLSARAEWNLQTNRVTTPTPRFEPPPASPDRQAAMTGSAARSVPRSITPPPRTRSPS
jgi:hypothetical protein